MRRFQILTCALVAGLAPTASAGSLNLYSKPGSYVVIGRLHAAPDRSIRLGVFARTRNRVELRIEFPRGREARGELMRRAASLFNQPVKVTGEVTLENGSGTLHALEIEASPLTPPLDPAGGDGFWKQPKTP